MSTYPHYRVGAAQKWRNVVTISSVWGVLTVRNHVFGSGRRAQLCLSHRAKRRPITEEADPGDVNDEGPQAPKVKKRSSHPTLLPSSNTSLRVNLVAKKPDQIKAGEP